jgi:release factor glutamine methyltransferase
VASTNADTLGALVTFIRLDFLNAETRNDLGSYDVLVSNPPYIPLAEQERIHTNVKDHEPNIALFVPDNDALVFYKAIAHFGHQHLSPNGYIYCELDAAHAHDCKVLFEAEGYRNVQLRQDMNGHWRMLKAQAP